MVQNNQRKDGYDSFEAWARKFEQSHLGKTAITELKALYRTTPSSLQKRLKEEVLYACYYAYLFWHIGDVNSEKRDLLRDLANQTDPLQETIKAAIKEIAFFQSIHDVLVREGARTHWGDDAIDMELPIKSDDLLCHLEFYREGIARFQDDLPTHTDREECWVYGNMRYPKRIDRKNQHNKKEASTCLMFQLGVFFRLWTHPDGQKLFDNDLNLTIPKKVPKKGQRHDKVIVVFVNATFANQAMAKKKKNPDHERDHHLLGENVSETLVRSRLEKVDKCILLVPWDASSFDVMTVSSKVLKSTTTGRTQKVD